MASVSSPQSIFVLLHHHLRHQSIVYTHLFLLIHLLFCHNSHFLYPSLSTPPSLLYYPLIPFLLCLLSSVTAVRLPDGLSFVVYEFWDGEEEWKRRVFKIT